jgi:2-polyprenyl-3-methyl-5-hydroxy-6-metoxy-1,4-benzoquinol methylase
MSVGLAARWLLGNKLFNIIGPFYRSLFVDLEKVADLMCTIMPKGSHVIDIGGGDGNLLNYMLTMRGDITAVMLDINTDIGNFIFEDYRDRVKLLPGTTIKQFANMTVKLPDFIIVSDVVHHIPQAARAGFFTDIYNLMLKSNALLLIKDVEPGHIISRLGYLSDRHISGDKNVSLISKAELCSLLENVFGQVSIKELGLFSEDKPNYILSISAC